MKQIINTKIPKTINISKLNDFVETQERIRNGVLLKVDYEKHVDKLKAFSELNEQVKYWIDELTSYSLLKPLKCENLSFSTEYSRHNKTQREYILRMELDRMMTVEIDKFKSTSILISFYARAETEIHDIEFLKKKSLVAIKDVITFGIGFFGDSEMIKKGYEAYNGGDSLEVTIDDLKFVFKSETLMENFTYIFEGYLLAKAKREIKSYDVVRGANNSNIKTNYIGLFIYAFGLENSSIFSDLEYGNTHKAKLFAKLFNLRETDSENLRKAMSNPDKKVSKPFLNWFKQFGIDPKDTHLNKYLPK
jgi:hypothetical protein